MKFYTAIAALAAAASAKEIPRDAKRHAELYETGLVHEKIMAAKAAQLQESEEMGVMAAVTYGPTYDELGFGQCKDGWAQPIRADTVNRFKCNNINMHHFLSHSQLGSATGLGSSSWGWVSDDGREFAIIAQGDGAAFAEVRYLLEAYIYKILIVVLRSPPLVSSVTSDVFLRPQALPPAAGGSSEPTTTSSS